MAFTIDNLLPYGFVSAKWMRDYQLRRVPVRFRLNERSVTPKEWQKWCHDQVIVPLSEAVWPRWEKGAWTGAAKGHALELTSADLNLMAELGGSLVQRSRGRNAKARTHRAMFEAEDEAFVGAVSEYLPEFDEAVLQAMQKSARSGLVDFGPAPLDFKLPFQRPRPYQVAYFLGSDTFVYEWAKTAITPAFISGHSIQGLLAACHIYVDHRRDLELTAGAVEQLQEMGVDIGDRRVFAGVHYASDNIGSWFTALKLSSHLFGGSGREAFEFIVNAIKRSLVFEKVAAECRVAGSPYLTPLLLLDAASEGMLPGAAERAAKPG